MQARDGLGDEKRNRKARPVGKGGGQLIDGLGCGENVGGFLLRKRLLFGAAGGSQEEQRRQQEILSTPLEKFGDGEVEDLAAKYAAMGGTEEKDSPVDTANLETFGDQDLKNLERKYGGKGADGENPRKQD